MKSDRRDLNSHSKTRPFPPSIAWVLAEHPTTLTIDIQLTGDAEETLWRDINDLAEAQAGRTCHGAERPDPREGSAQGTDA